MIRLIIGVLIIEWIDLLKYEKKNKKVIKLI